MDTKLTMMQRPMGPRMNPRSSSPSPPTLSDTPPLVIRKPQKPSLSLSQTGPTGRSLTPMLNLNIPSRSATPRPPIRVDIPLNGNNSSVYDGGDSPHEIYSYYGGGPPGSLLPTVSPDNQDMNTVRPQSSNSDKPTQMPVEPLADVRGMLHEIYQIKSSLSVKAPDSTDDDALSTSELSSDLLQWSDDVLEELSRLGEGAGGAVHKVRDKRTGKILARKTITTREAPVRQLLRELSMISSLKHVNIIPFHGAYMSSSSSEVKLVMEYGEGGSLEAVGKQIKERGAVVGEKIAGRLAEGILQGLAYLHTKRTIHRDIKPSNVLLSHQGVVKLCDFGVSGELVNSYAATFTGTSFYMAPERICGHEYTIRSDVWSTGISLLELVQNRFPFPNDLPPIELMMYITTEEPPRLEDEPGVQRSDEMKDFIKQTLTVDALTRPTPKDMLAHPWIINVMKQEVHMARWMCQVWGWPISNRRSRDGSSRPSTGISDRSKAS